MKSLRFFPRVVSLVGSRVHPRIGTRVGSVLICLLLSLFLFVNCSSDGGGGGGGPSKDVPNPDENKGTDNPAGNPTPAPTPAPLTGSLNIGNIDGFGVAETSTQSGLAFTLNATSSSALVAVDKDGKISSIDLPATPDYDPASSEKPVISQVLTLGAFGVIVQFGDFRYYRHTNALWIKKDGTLVSFAPEGFTPSNQFFLRKFEIDLDGKIWVLGEGGAGSGSIFTFDPVSSTFTVFTDSNLVVSDFALTSDNAVYVSGNTSAGVAFVRRLKPNGAVEEIYSDSSGVVGISAGVPLGRFLLRENKLHEVVSDAVQTFYLPQTPQFPLNDIRGKSLPVPLIGGKWLLGWQNKDSSSNPTPLAFNVNTRAIASQFLTQNYSRLGKATGANGGGLVFDGTNISKFTLNSDSTNVFRAENSLNIMKTGKPAMKAVRAFGALQGFETSYKVLARVDGSSTLWLGDLEGGSGTNAGLLKTLLPIDFTDSGLSEPEWNVLNYGMIFRLAAQSGGHDLYLLLGNNAAQPLFRLVAGSGSYTLTAVSASALNPYNSNFGKNALVKNDALYLPVGSGVWKIQPSAASNQQTLIEILRTSEPSNGSCLKRTFAIAPVGADGSKPAILRRGCGSSGEMIAAQFEVTVYQDFSFTEDVSNPVQTLSLSYTEAQTGEIGQGSDQVEFIPVSESRYLVSFPKIKQAVELLFDQTVSSFAQGRSSLSFSSLQTVGLKRTANSFGVGSALEFAAAWSGETFIASGVLADSSRRSFKVDLADDTEKELSDLEGVQVYTGTPGPKNTFWVSGNDVAANRNVLYRFDSDGTLVGQDSQSNVKVLQIAVLKEEE